MRQYCRPHTVKRATSTSTASATTAVIAHASAIHTNDGTSSRPQSSDGVNPSSIALSSHHGCPGEATAALRCGGDRRR